MSESCPLTRERAVDLYFMEHRAMLIDVAAFLDRLDRASGPAEDDFRMQAFREALNILSDDQPHRAKRILELFSDPTSDPIPTAGMKGAQGAFDRTEATG